MEKKYWKSQGILSAVKSGNHVHVFKFLFHSFEIHAERDMLKYMTNVSSDFKVSNDIRARICDENGF